MKESFIHSLIYSFINLTLFIIGSLHIGSFARWQRGKVGLQLLTEFKKYFLSLFSLWKLRFQSIRPPPPKPHVYNRSTLNTYCVQGIVLFTVSIRMWPWDLNEEKHSVHVQSCSPMGLWSTAGRILKCLLPQISSINP